MKAVPNAAGTGVYKPGQVRLSSTFVNQGDAAGTAVVGWAVLGDVLYRSDYELRIGTGQYQQQPRLIRIGSGWSSDKLVEEMNYLVQEHGQTLRTSAYGLRNDGTLFRWQVNGLTWRRTGSASGFAAVKTMALISKTRTYDTFLANTRGGALYTVRIPTTAPMRPVVKPVRTKTWQVFESLLAVKCGVSGTLLLGIDKDTKAGYL